MPTLYKFLTEDGRGTYSGQAWSLPTAAGPGDWMPAITGPLVPCDRGYHLCREGDLLYWLGPVLYEAEYRGERVDVDGEESKVVVREARLVQRVTTWDDRAMRLFACDCAERVLPIYERAVPSDARPRTAIAVARRFAAGEATSAELAIAEAAARDAARDAARAAARDAAWDAARAAARAAAWAAARVAARAAAGAVAGAVERQWQTARLLAYLDGTVQPLTMQEVTP